jgi:hypothetical protein
MTYQELKDIVGEGKPFLFGTTAGQIKWWGVFGGAVLWTGMEGYDPYPYCPVMSSEVNWLVLVDWFEEPANDGCWGKSEIPKYNWSNGSRGTSQCTCPTENFTINAIGCKCGGV